jgi:hypothetical protein
MKELFNFFPKPIVIGIISAILSSAITLFLNKRSLEDSLDSKSGWRTKLFDAASAYPLGLNQVLIFKNST